MQQEERWCGPKVRRGINHYEIGFYFIKFVSGKAAYALQSRSYQFFLSNDDLNSRRQVLNPEAVS
jgi:hypothetical protein